MIDFCEDFQVNGHFSVLHEISGIFRTFPQPPRRPRPSKEIFTVRDASIDFEEGKSKEKHDLSFSWNGAPEDAIDARACWDCSFWREIDSTYLSLSLSSDSTI